MTAGAPRNRFADRLARGGCQTGLWLSTCSATVAEIVCGAGPDFAVIDTEHAPNTVTSVLDQLRVLRGLGVDGVVRPPANDPVEIRRYLDAGAQTLLIPMVNTADQARAAVAATRYPPAGTRGVSLGHRSNGYGRDAGYFAAADAAIRVIPQIETRQAVDNLEDILAVEGVAALFVGPADLTADMGLIGQADCDAFRHLLREIADRVAAGGGRFGTLVAGASAAADRRALGAGFVVVDTDVGLLRRGSDAVIGAVGTYREAT